MNRYTVRGLVALSVALWALKAFTADGSLPVATIAPDQIAPNTCGPVPSESDVDGWYAYGDCSGDYGPIDAAE